MGGASVEFLIMFLPRTWWLDPVWEPCTPCVASGCPHLTFASKTPLQGKSNNPSLTCPGAGSTEPRLPAGPAWLGPYPDILCLSPCMCGSGPDVGRTSDLAGRRGLRAAQGWRADCEPVACRVSREPVVCWVSCEPALSPGGRVATGRFGVGPRQLGEP